jgi:hypothetical protein
MMGAGVFAINNDTGDEINVIVGGNPDLSSNAYVLEAVPTGSYTVSLRALDGSAEVGGTDTSTSGNVDSIFLPTPFSFPTNYFNATSSEADATAVDVETGAVTGGINFGSSAFCNALFAQLFSDPDGCQAVPARGVLSLSALFYWISPLLSVFILKRFRRDKRHLKDRIS